jgi:hypothetical protein
MRQRHWLSGMILRRKTASCGVHVFIAVIEQGREVKVDFFVTSATWFKYDGRFDQYLLQGGGL